MTRLKSELVAVVLLGLVVLSTALPVTKTEEKKEPAKEEHGIKYDEGYGQDDPRNRPDMQLEYSKYLAEVVSALENDPEFRAKLDKADEADIRSGKIAQELDYVSHHVRSRLDELKREELERLRQLAIKHFEMTNEIDRDHLKISEHIDHENPHTFEVEDLRKLIHKTGSELAEADRLRREEFKRYEMQKEFEQHQKLAEMDETHKKEYEEQLKKEKEKHNKHDPVHAPGHKAQLEEVWEKQDHMEGQDFDPKTFFMMHDLDGNGVWDELEVKALFARELDKVYQSGVPEDDMRERAEEMERMREHVFKEADTNQDHLISYEEFIEQTKRAEFQQDQKWETVDNVPQYTHEEYLEYERKRQEEVQRLIAEGLLPPHPNMPGGYHPGPGQPMYQQHPNEIPHYGGGGQYPNQQVHHDAAARMADDHHQAQQMHYQQQQYHAPQGVPVQQQQQQFHAQPPPQGVPQQHPPQQQQQYHQAAGQQPQGNVQYHQQQPPVAAAGAHVNPPPPPQPAVPQQQQQNVQQPQAAPVVNQAAPQAAAAPQGHPQQNVIANPNAAGQH